MAHLTKASIDALRRNLPPALSARLLDGRQGRGKVLLSLHKVIKPRSETWRIGIMPRLGGNRAQALRVLYRYIRIARPDWKVNAYWVWNHSYHDCDYAPALLIGPGVRNHKTIDEILAIHGKYSAMATQTAWESWGYAKG